MTEQSVNLPKIKWQPLIQDCWHDFETLMGEKGGCGGCWCMSWRVRRAVFKQQKGDGNRQAMAELVRQNEPVGILAYLNDQPVGWCAVAPREKYIRLENSRVLSRIDDQPVWSVSCFYVARPYRRQGISVELIKGAIEYCRQLGVKIIEAYPYEPYSKEIPPVFIWTGIPAAFAKAGFVVAARRSAARPIMRYYL